MHYVICDIETTGGSPKNSKITEIAIYKHDGEKIIDTFETLVNPKISIPPFIVNLTGISDEMVINSPIFSEIAKDILDFTKDCIFVAHNVAFDYGVIRAEFRSIGIDYRRPHLCTVKASREILPGKDSYSLGKLTRSLGIDLIGRHRAGGDALATAHLFKIIFQLNKNKLEKLIKEELNPTDLHPNLAIEILDDIPNKIGIYRFYNENNQIIFIGKSPHLKKRIRQHFQILKTKNAIQMQKEIAKIEYELTGSELIAMLKEAQLIKQYTPKFNRLVKKSGYGLYNYIDKKGYNHFYITENAKMNEEPLASFSTKKEGIDFLEKIVEKNKLCRKLCDLEKSNGACFQFQLKACEGACVKQESTKDYNKKCNAVIDGLNFNHSSFYIIEKGREKSERSIVFVKNGNVKGYGFAPFHFNRLKPISWDVFITYTFENDNNRKIIKSYLKKKKELNLVYL